MCADPDDLPFTSSVAGAGGLYLDLADLIAERLGTRVEPVFFRTDMGLRALRPTLLAGRCDVLFGLPWTPSGVAGRSIRITRPFLDVGYAVVAPKAFVLRGLQDLAGKTIGVEYESTPQTILAARAGLQLVTFRTAEEAIDALDRHEIDFAFVWGPTAGYRAARRGLLDRFKIVSVKGLALRGQATAGVRAEDQQLQERLDRELAALGPEIAMLADKYHLPTDPPVDLEATVAAMAAPGQAPTPAPGAAPAPSTANQRRVNPYHGDPAALAEGRTLFNVHCSHCHSPNATSPDPVRDLRRLDHRYGERVNDVFYETVTKGRPTKGMPTWGPVLDEETIWKIKTFLESVQATPGG